MAYIRAVKTTRDYKPPTDEDSNVPKSILKSQKYPEDFE